jgi:hypothetical protein
MGAYLDDSFITDEHVKKINESRLSDPELTIEDVKQNFSIYADLFLTGSDLQSSSGPDYYSDEIMVGSYYTQMNEDETLGQFRERVKKEIKKLFGIDVNPSHIEACWEDR